jgi:hypothetical protein
VGDGDDVKSYRLDDLSHVVAHFEAGDGVIIAKEKSSKFGHTAVVTDGDWNGMVRVRMGDGDDIKSYRQDDLLHSPAGAAARLPASAQTSTAAAAAAATNAAAAVTVVATDTETPAPNNMGTGTAAVPALVAAQLGAATTLAPFHVPSPSACRDPINRSKSSLWA